MSEANLFEQPFRKPLPEHVPDEELVELQELTEHLAPLSAAAQEIRDIEPTAIKLSPGESQTVRQEDSDTFLAREAKTRFEIPLGKGGRVEAQGLTFKGDGTYKTDEDGYAVVVDKNGIVSIFLADGSKGKALPGYGIMGSAFALESLVDSSLKGQSMQQAKEAAHNNVIKKAEGANATAVGLRLSPERKMDRMSCGDATLHMIRKNQLSATVIENLAAEKVRARKISSRQYYGDSHENNFSKSLTTASLGSDLGDLPAYKTETLEPEEEIVFVLASDCLRDWVSDLEIQQHLQQYGHDLNLLQKKLFELIYNRGNGTEFFIQETAEKNAHVFKSGNNGDNMTLVVGKAKMPAMKKGFSFGGLFSK